MALPLSPHERLASAHLLEDEQHDANQWFVPHRYGGKKTEIQEGLKSEEVTFPLYLNSMMLMRCGPTIS